MSPNDLSRIHNIGGPRALGRETALSGDKPAVSAPRVPDAKPEAAVRVETDAALQSGPPPVDLERVAKIKEAISRGTYPILPTKVADAIIAAPILLSAKA